ERLHGRAARRAAPGRGARRPAADLADVPRGAGAGGAAGAVDGGAGLPGAAADPAEHRRAVRRVHPGELRGGLHLLGVLGLPGDHAGLRDPRHRLGHRAGPRGGAGPAPGVPGPRPGARVDAAALRRARGGRDVRLGRDAQPPVRCRQRRRHGAARLGGAGGVPQPAHQRGLAPRPRGRGAHGAADGGRLRDVALVPLRLPVPHRPAAGRAGHPGGGGAGRRRHPHAALPAHPAAPAAADHRRPGAAALHLDVQQLRRHLPAHRRGRGHRRRQRPGVRLPRGPRRRRRRLGAGPGARGGARGARGDLPAVRGQGGGGL
ncbi:MAG: Inner membrane ABC transporter permease protein YcjO, partial [uncultured Quadrisphaera sp.]